MTKKIGFLDPVGMKAGMDKLDISLAEGFAEFGVSSVVYSNFSRESNQNIKYHKIFGTEKFTSLAGLSGFVFGILKAIRNLKAEKVGTVVVHHFNSNILTFMMFVCLYVSRINVLTIAHDISSFSGDDIALFRKLIFNRFSKNIAVHNEHSKNELRKYLSKENVDKIYLVNYVMPVREVASPQKKVDARKALGLDENKIYMLFFGQIKAVKGLDLLLNELPKIDESVELLIAGNPGNNNFQKYQDIIDSLQIQDRVKKWTRFIEDDEMDLFFSASDFSILPYSKIYQSAVFYDSLSYGLPIVASDLKFFSDVEKECTAVRCFALDNVTEISKTVNNLVMDRSALDTIGPEGRRYLVENHSINMVANMHLQSLGLDGTSS